MNCLVLDYSWLFYHQWDKYKKMRYSFMNQLMISSATAILTILLVQINLTTSQGSEVTVYCPFYNNRGISPQPFLKNCTWYNDNACCQQIEIDYGFANVKPPQGASAKCLQQLNYLMCYICDPTQYKFYSNEYLTVCSEFCDNLYDACKDAILKGSVISNLYRSGHEFCQSRRFRVKNKDESGDCFYYSDDLAPKDNGRIHCISWFVLLATAAVSLIYWRNR